MPYKTIFGGVTAISVDHFKQVNGYSNLFWKWGGEDDDMWNRLRENGLPISRYNHTVARYRMQKHSKAPVNPKR